MPRRSARYKRRSRARKFRKYFLLGGLAFSFILFLSFYAFYKQFHKTYIFAESANAASFGGSEELTAVALLTSSAPFSEEAFSISTIRILLVSPTHETFTVYEISPETLVDMPGKYGYEKLSKSFALGTLDFTSSGSCVDDCLNTGLEYTRTVLQNLLGTKIDRLVLTDPALEEFSEKLLVEGKISDIFSRKDVHKLKNSFRTDMTFTDFFTFYKYIRNYSRNDIDFRNFSTGEEFDAFLRTLTYNSPMALEKSSIAILNGADVAGLAGFGARVAENRGGHVVAAENALEISQETYLIAMDPSAPAVKYLADFFEVENVYSRREISLSDPVLDRADVTLLLGLDFVPKY